MELTPPPFPAYERMSLAESPVVWQGGFRARVAQARAEERGGTSNGNPFVMGGGGGGADINALLANFDLTSTQQPVGGGRGEGRGEGRGRGGNGIPAKPESLPAFLDLGASYADSGVPPKPLSPPRVGGRDGGVGGVGGVDGERNDGERNDGERDDGEWDGEWDEEAVDRFVAVVGREGESGHGHPIHSLDGKHGGDARLKAEVMEAAEEREDEKDEKNVVVTLVAVALAVFVMVVDELWVLGVFEENGTNDAWIWVKAVAKLLAWLVLAAECAWAAKQGKMGTVQLGLEVFGLAACIFDVLFVISGGEDLLVDLCVGHAVSIGMASRKAMVVSRALHAGMLARIGRAVYGTTLGSELDLPHVSRRPIRQALRFMGAIMTGVVMSVTILLILIVGLGVSPLPEGGRIATGSLASQLSVAASYVDVGFIPDATAVAVRDFVARWDGGAKVLLVSVNGNAVAGTVGDVDQMYQIYREVWVGAPLAVADSVGALPTRSPALTYVHVDVSEYVQHNAGLGLVSLGLAVVALILGTRGIRSGTEALAGGLVGHTVSCLIHEVRASMERGDGASELAAAAKTNEDGEEILVRTQRKRRERYARLSAETPALADAYHVLEQVQARNDALMLHSLRLRSFVRSVFVDRKRLEMETLLWRAKYGRFPIPRAFEVLLAELEREGGGDDGIEDRFFDVGSILVVRARMSAPAVLRYLILLFCSAPGQGEQKELYRLRLVELIHTWAETMPEDFGNKDVLGLVADLTKFILPITDMAHVAGVVNHAMVASLQHYAEYLRAPLPWPLPRPGESMADPEGVAHQLRDLVSLARHRTSLLAFVESGRRGRLPFELNRVMDSVSRWCVEYVRAHRGTTLGVEDVARMIMIVRASVAHCDESVSATLIKAVKGEGEGLFRHVSGDLLEVWKDAVKAFQRRVYGRAEEWAEGRVRGVLVSPVGESVGRLESLWRGGGGGEREREWVVDLGRVVLDAGSRIGEGGEGSSSDLSDGGDGGDGGDGVDGGDGGDEEDEEVGGRGVPMTPVMTPIPHAVTPQHLWQETPSRVGRRSGGRRRGGDVVEIRLGNSRI